VSQPNSETNLSADVVVIGGGPGGSTAATMLARQGWQVLLLERDVFPRDHVGESLLPASIPVLEELGVLTAVQGEGFLPKWGATMVWGQSPDPWSWYFRETNQKYPHSYQVWRPRFDQLLLENAQAAGVTALQGYRVEEVLFHPDETGEPAGRRATGVNFVNDLGKAGIVQARFVVDASGQNGLLGRQLDLRHWDDFFQNLAVYAYYQGGQRLAGDAENNIFIESYPHGWLWNIPLADGWSSVGAVVDRHYGGEALRRQNPRQFLAEQIAQAPHTARMLESASLVSGPQVVRDWSYACREIAGEGYVLLGDAACFVDPLFSSGVHLALMSGVLAAAYVTTALKDPSMARAAGRVYQELYYKEYQHFRELVRLFYSSNRTSDSYFWEARRISGPEDALTPRQSFIQAVAGQPPRGYERAVLEHGEAPIQFVESVRQIEAEREEHRIQAEAALLNPGVTFAEVYRAVPHLREGVEVQRKPVLTAGEFVWGDVLITEGHPEGIPCSPLVARLVSAIDGKRSVTELLAELGQGLPPYRRDQLEASVFATLRILYVDGTITRLEGI
jgi:flavin-dependent dehydrogenase